MSDDELLTAAASAVTSRMRLAHRVLGALNPLENGEVVEQPTTSRARSSGPSLRTDLVLRLGELRILLCLLPTVGDVGLEDDNVLASAFALLFADSTTAAVVLVADDELLSARLLEPFDSPSTVRTTNGPTSTPAIEPLVSLVRSYTNRVTPHWELPSKVRRDAALLGSVAHAAAVEARLGLQAQAKRTPEWRIARASIDDRDAAAIADLAVSLLSDPALDARVAIRRRLGGRNA